MLEIKLGAFCGLLTFVGERSPIVLGGMGRNTPATSDACDGQEKIRRIRGAVLVFRRF
jgi:hypothetical protein